MAKRTTRYPNGITTAKKTEPFGEFILPDESKVHKFFEDFDYFRLNVSPALSDWTETEIGNANVGLIDGDGGLLNISNGSNDDDSDFLQKIGRSFLFETGKRLWFDCLFNISDATQSDMVIGLQVTDTTPLDVSDGVFFIKNDGVATVDLVVEGNNTATITSSVATLVNSTNIRLGFFYNGKDEISIFADNVKVGSSSVVNLPTFVLTISFGIQNGEAVSKDMMVDYIFVAKER